MLPVTRVRAGRNAARHVHQVPSTPANSNSLEQSQQGLKKVLTSPPKGLLEDARRQAWLSEAPRTPRLESRGNSVRPWKSSAAGVLGNTGLQELREEFVAPQACLWKVRLCPRHLTGGCASGDTCPFAHGVDELRSSWVTAEAMARQRMRGLLVVEGQDVPQCRRLVLAPEKPLEQPEPSYAPQQPQVTSADRDDPSENLRRAWLRCGTGSAGAATVMDCAVSKVAHKICVEQIVANPHDVLFANPVILERFSCGRSVESTIQALSNGSIDVTSIPLIRVVKRLGKLVTLDHRRLYAFQAALPLDAQVPMKLVHSAVLADQYMPRSGRFQATVGMVKSTPRRFG